MAARKTILATNEIYHVYNRGVEKRPLFLNRKDYSRFKELINYYRFTDCPLKYSYFKLMSQEDKAYLFHELETKSQRFLEIFAFCLMPNHFHFLMQQKKDNGISKFMAKIANGYSHYFNTKNKRLGHLFQGNFSAVRIETDEQLVHVSRYIHLNPVTSYLIAFKDLENYDYSSFPEYISEKKSFVNTQVVLSYFKDSREYKEFVKDQVDYARQLDNIKHLLLE